VAVLKTIAANMRNNSAFYRMTIVGTTNYISELKNHHNPKRSKGNITVKAKMAWRRLRLNSGR
jgi:hypothetical protein